MKDALIKKLKECANHCDHCYNACKNEHSENLEQCMLYDQDCADICILTINYLQRNSDNSNLILKACSIICEKCAKECYKHAHMEHCKKCAEICFEVAEMCYQIPAL